MIFLMVAVLSNSCVEIHGAHLLMPFITSITDSQDTMSSCREYAIEVLSADWEYNKHNIGKVLPEQREYAQQSAVSFARKQVHDWETQGIDYCPFAGTSSRSVGTEAMNSRISQGQWMFVSEDELDEWFTETEIKALRGEVAGECLPDGTARHWPRKVGKQSLHLAWSSCSKQAGGCKSMRDVVHWMTTRGMARLLLAGDSMMEQFFGAVLCSLKREGCTIVEKGCFVEKGCNNHHVFCPSNSSTNQTLGEVNIKFVPRFGPRFLAGEDDNLSSELHAADIAIVNQGHHGLTRMEEAMKLMANQADENLGTQRKVFWSQTSQPHFPSEDGSWSTETMPFDVDFNQVDPSLMMCSPLKNRSQEFGINAAADKLLKQVDVQHNIRALPFHQFSAGRWDMHGNWGGTADAVLDVGARSLHWTMDCLHLVYSPTFYAPYIGLLYEALEHSSRPLPP